MMLQALYISNFEDTKVNKIRKIVSVLILLSIVLVSLCKVSFLLENKASKRRYSDFFECKTNIDVLFFGSSHVRYGFFPMELWNDYGITAFNLAGNGSTIPVSYWVLVNALDYHMPKVVVMDVYDIWPGVISSGSGQVHGQIDAFPLTINKIKMINDLYDKDNLTEETKNAKAYELYDKKYTLLWSFSEYHSRWNELIEKDFDTPDDVMKISATWKGAEPLRGTVVREERKYSQDTSQFKYDELAKRYLLQIIQLCKEKSISLILINTGYDCDDTSKLFADSIKDISKEYDVPYLDFTKMDIIDFKSDINSTGVNTHVNFSGAEKFTNYIGKYISDNYELEDYRNNENYTEWEKDYEEFKNSKILYLEESKTLSDYLMFLADDDYQIIVEVGKNEILYSDVIQSMFENLGVDYKELNDKTNLIAIDSENKDATCISYEYNTMVETLLGEVGIFNNSESNKCGLYLNGYEIGTQEISENFDLRISVIDKCDKQVIDNRDFSLHLVSN